MSVSPESFVDRLDADPAEEVKAEVKVDEVKDKVDAAKPEEKAEKVVPLKALQEEREAAKELKRQIAELQAQPKLSDEDKQLLAELKAAKAAQAAKKDVDFMDDPKGYVDSKVQRALDELKTATEKTEKVDTEFNQQRQIQALMTAVSTAEADFVAQTPDYYEALNHVRTVRASQMRLMDDTLTDAQVNNAIAQEELQAANHLLKKGADPCKFAYEYSKTLGYVKKATEVESDMIKAAKAADKAGARTMGAGGGDAPADQEDDSDDPNAEFRAVKNIFRRK